MSEENEVVIEESNPTNEDHSIDAAISELYDTQEVESTPETPATEDNEVIEDTQDDVVEDVEVSSDEAVEFSLPENMPKELQDSLSNFDQDVQEQGAEVFKKMQGAFTKKNQDFAEEKKFAESINQAFESNGGGVKTIEEKKTLVNNFIAFDRLLETDPKDAVKRMMDYAGLKPDDFGVNLKPTESSEDEFLTDSELKTKQTIDALTEQVNQLTQQGATNRQETQSKIVDDFRNETNEAGELVHPHWDAVKQDMLMLADVNPNLTIEQIYNKSVRMNDDLHSQFIEGERKAALNTADVKRKAGVEKAKKLNKQSRPTSSVDSVVVDEDAIFDQIAASAGWS